jgi:hypothetical protein
MAQTAASHDVNRFRPQPARVLFIRHRCRVKLSRASGDAGVVLIFLVSVAYPFQQSDERDALVR